MPDPINTGGPAFPCVDHMGDGPTGMTLRDYFAAKADLSLIYGEDGLPPTLAITVMGSHYPQYTDDPIANATWWADAYAKLRYIHADAMLRARDAKPEGTP